MITIPTPFQVGDVNIYMLGDTLIDTGPDTNEARTVLHSIDLNPVTHVVVTHGHVDHHGLAFYIKEKTDCTVFVHKNDFLPVSDYKNELERKAEVYKDFLEKSGISKGFVSVFEKYYSAFKDYGEKCEAELLKDTFATEKGLLKVIHTPGHTGGSCCFLLGDVLYSGDTLLPTISTNPSIHAIFDEQCGLKSYRQSLENIAAFDVKKVLPGHGPVITDHRKRIHKTLQETSERREKVKNCLSRTPQPLADVSKKVFGELPLTEILLALAECYDHLKVLESEGIAEILEEDIYYFRLI